MRVDWGSGEVIPRVAKPWEKIGTDENMKTSSRNRQSLNSRRYIILKFKVVLKKYLLNLHSYSKYRDFPLEMFTGVL